MKLLGFPEVMQTISVTDSNGSSRTILKIKAHSKCAIDLDGDVDIFDWGVSIPNVDLNEDGLRAHGVMVVYKVAMIRLCYVDYLEITNTRLYQMMWKL